MKKRLILVAIALLILWRGCVNLKAATDMQTIKVAETAYEFTFDEKTISAVFFEEESTWKVIDSYRLSTGIEIYRACTEMCQLHPVIGANGTYRSPADLCHEWIIHNMAFYLLPANNKWKESAKDVDLDPEDQWLTPLEMWKRRQS